MSLGVVSRFQSDSKQTHVDVVKIIFIYLKGITNYGLWYQNCQELTLKSFTDADLAESFDDRKSTSGAAFFWEIVWYHG